LLGYADEIVLPFQYHQGFIIVDVVVGKLLPLKFIMDTGAENTILLKKEIADVLKLSNHKNISVYGSDLETEVHAHVSNGVSLQLVNCQTVKKNILILEEDYLVLEQYLGKRVDGILGVDFLDGLAIRIDYQNGELTIINPHFPYTKKVKYYQAFDIEVIEHKPYLLCDVEVVPNKIKKSRMLIDSGAGLTFLLHNNSDTLLRLPDNIIKGNLGKGLGGEIQGYCGKAHKLSFGSYYFNNALCSFQEIQLDSNVTKKVVRNGLIGNLLLERFDVIIDFNAKKLYLKAKYKYNKEFEYDRSGLTIFAYGLNFNLFFIKDILPNSPGIDAGLLPGDVVMKVGYWPTKLMTLRQMNKIFVGKAGRKLRLKIKRGDQIIRKEIVLRNLF
jgi:predicted aspartyl protease